MKFTGSYSMTLTLTLLLTIILILNHNPRRLQPNKDPINFILAKFRNFYPNCKVRTVRTEQTLSQPLNSTLKQQGRRAGYHVGYRASTLSFHVSRMP